MPAVEDTVRDFIVANFLFGDTTRAVRDDDSLLEHGIIDSTGILELVGFVEKTWSITVKDADIVPANFDSIGRIAAYVANNAGQSAAA